MQMLDLSDAIDLAKNLVYSDRTAKTSIAEEEYF